jgi:hypothetical protein
MPSLQAVVDGDGGLGCEKETLDERPSERILDLDRECVLLAVVENFECVLRFLRIRAAFETSGLGSGEEVRVGFFGSTAPGLSGTEVVICCMLDFGWVLRNDFEYVEHTDAR